MKSCFMFGHADAPDIIMPRLEQAIERYYSKDGLTDFYVGNVTGTYTCICSWPITQQSELSFC